MHKIFGIKESENYIDRKGAYLIPVKNNTVAVVQTPKGYFCLVVALKVAKVMLPA